MIATMYSVRCQKCGGENAPIFSGEHLNELHCDHFKNQCVKTLEMIETALMVKVEAQMPGDSIPDRIALPKLERLEARQTKITESIALLRSEILK